MGLTTSQYNQIMRHYDELQFRARHIHESRRREVVNKCPEYDILEKRVIEISFRNTELILEGTGEDAERKIAELKDELTLISAKKRALLTANGFPDDYLEPVYFCKDCKDTGYIDNEKCHCFKQAAVDILYTQSNIKEILSKENFDTFDITLYSKDPKEARDGVTPYERMTINYKACQDFIERFDKERKNLLLYGFTGLGKTFLTHCIANELLKKGHTVLYLTAPQMFDALGKELRGGWSEVSSTEMTDYIMSCELLIIDDLGSELSTSFTISKFNEVLNERMIRNLSTVISTNLSLGDIGSVYGGRVSSRVIGNFDILFFYGKDIRIKKRMS